MSEFSMCVTGDRPRVIYTSLARADKAIEQFRLETKRDDKEAYLCHDCGGWHVGKRKARADGSG